MWFGTIAVCGVACEHVPSTAIRLTSPAVRHLRVTSSMIPVSADHQPLSNLTAYFSPPGLPVYYCLSITYLRPAVWYRNHLSYYKEADIASEAVYHNTNILAES